MEKLKIGITHGYTNGVSYEVILKSFENPTALELCTPIVYGSPKLAIYHRKALEVTTNFCTVQSANEAIKERLNIIECFNEEVKVDLGTRSEEADKAMAQSRQRGLRDCEEGMIDALVAAPGDVIEESKLTVLINQNMKIGIVTGRMPLAKVAPLITEENVMNKLCIFDKCLQRDFGITRPRIALLTLNPTPGKEEADVLTPIIKKAEEQQICAVGPFEAGPFFGSTAYLHYDGILAMYHDQVIAPLQMTGLDYNICLQAGEETVKTAPIQDAELEKAGRGEANIQSFCQALYTAIDVCRNRASYDEAHRDPLPKLFYDKREESKRPPKAE